MRYIVVLFVMAYSLFAFNYDTKVEVYTAENIAKCAVDDLRVCQKDTNSTINGIVKTFYKDNTIKKEIYFKDGIINGMLKSYYPNGKIALFANYQNGRLNGISKEYYENGKLKKEINYTDGKLDGIAKSYYENEQVQIKYVTSNNNGVVEMYDEKGNLTQKLTIENGVIIKDKE